MVHRFMLAQHQRKILLDVSESMIEKGFVIELLLERDLKQAFDERL